MNFRFFVFGWKSFPVLSVVLFFTGSLFAQQDTAPKPGEMVDALNAAFGKHHARAVHAKGIILEGTFKPSKEAAGITVAPHLQRQSSTVQVRFSDFTGIPEIPDNDPHANPRGMAIRFIMKGNATTDIVSHSFNGFPTATTAEFRQLLLALSQSGPEAAKPTKIEQFLAEHPVAKAFLTNQKTPLGFTTTNYFGVNSFKFTNSKRKTFFIRYKLATEDGEKFVTPDEASKKDKEYLFTDIKQRIGKGPAKFKLYAQIAEEGDEIENPSIAWPESRKLVLLGVITINKISKNTESEDKAFTPNPGNIPRGIELADPMLKIRQNAYPISVKDRQ